MTTDTVTPPVYTLGTNPAERTRLQGQADELAAHTLTLLEHADLAVGGRALELGCGPAGSIAPLAERVGPSGSVVAIDIDPTHVALARQYVKDRELANVEVLQGDARATGLPEESFDVVHARLLLVNIPSPQQVVAEMVRLVKPGGWVLTDEGDAETQVCYPPHPAWDELATIFQAAYRSDDADLLIGRKLPALLHDAGLVDVGVEARPDMYPAGHPRRTILADLVRSMHDKITERRIASDDDLVRLDGEARAHLAKPETLTVFCLYFLAWGKKPVASCLTS